MTREPAKSGDLAPPSRSYEEFFERNITVLWDVFKSGNEGALYEAISICLKESPCRDDGSKAYLGSDA